LDFGKKQKVTFIVGLPIKHFIPLYVVHLVFSYDIDFFNYLASFLRVRKNRRKTRRTNPNDEQSMGPAVTGVSERTKFEVRGRWWREGVFKELRQA
jgi:hypothetical protein